MAAFALSPKGTRSKEEFVDEFLTCSICVEPYDSGTRQAKCLPCLHTYCKSCLQSVAGKGVELDCPKCRKQVKFPGETVESLPNNFLVENLREYQNIFDLSVTCGNCDDNNPAILLFCLVLKYRMTFYFFNSKFGINHWWRLSLIEICHCLRSRVIRLWLTVRQSSVHFLVVHGLRSFNYFHQEQLICMCIPTNNTILVTMFFWKQWFTSYFSKFGSENVMTLTRKKSKQNSKLIFSFVGYRFGGICHCLCVGQYILQNYSNAENDYPVISVLSALRPEFSFFIENDLTYTSMTIAFIS